MFAVAFDLVVADLEATYPRHFSQAYAEVASVLQRYGSRRVQDSVYVCEREDLATMTSAMVALRALAGFPACVRDVRAFRVEQWSDFTAFMKESDR
jgi:virulence-associated protein VapD